MASTSYAAQKTLFIPFRLLPVKAHRLAPAVLDAPGEAPPTVVGAWDAAVGKSVLSPGELTPSPGKGQEQTPVLRGFRQY